MRKELDAILKGCGEYYKGVSMDVRCKHLNERCLMPDDTPDCPVWIEWSEDQTSEVKQT